MKEEWLVRNKYLRTGFKIGAIFLILISAGLFIFYFSHQGSGNIQDGISYERELKYNDLVNDAYRGNPEANPLEKNKKIEWIIRKSNTGDSTIENLFIKYDDEKIYLVQIKVGTEEWTGLSNWAHKHGIEINTKEVMPRIQWKNQLPSIIIGLLLVFVIGLTSWWMLTRGPLSGWGKKFLKRKSQGEFQKIITFNDVAGVDDAKEEVMEVGSFLIEPEKFKSVGARMPHGVLLIGPPGTGKTLLAEAAAHEAKVPFKAIGGSGFHEMFIGVGSSRFRDLIDWVIKNAPDVLIIDEIDSAGAKRFSGVFHDEAANLTNEMLHGLDILEKEEIPAIVFGITNRPDMLDPALLRSGRFDRHIEIGLPDADGRRDILQVHFTRPRIRPIDPNFDLNQIVRETRGFSGADLAALVNEAAIRSARRLKTLSAGEKIVINHDDFNEAILRVLIGSRKKLKFREIEKKILAWHEAGHVLAAKLLSETDEVRFVTILPRGRAGGFTRLLPYEEVHVYTQNQIFNQMKVFLAGRAVEELEFKGFSTSASGDLEVVESLARNAVCIYGMSKLGPIYVPQTSGYSYWVSPVWQGKIGELAELEIKDVKNQEYKKVFELLGIKENKDKIDDLAKKLLEKPFIPGDEIDGIIGTIKKIEN